MNSTIKRICMIAAAVVLVFCAQLLPGRSAAVNALAAGNEVYTVRVESGYLALRTAMAFDSSNEIGKLYTGETVQVQDKSGGQYWWVYAPSLGKYGYVNKDYLRATSGSYTGTNTMTVKVSDGYLALRTAKAFDYNNEIGKLYTGDVVEVITADSSQYWWVYAPALGKSGYVNKDYLTGSRPTTTGTSAYAQMKVKVETSYLALRTAKAFAYENEIGKLWTGDVVSVIDSSDSQYWYVYASTLGKYGYVNKDYLVSMGGSSNNGGSSNYGSGNAGSNNGGNTGNAGNNGGNTGNNGSAANNGGNASNNGGNSDSAADADDPFAFTVKIDKGYLALRSTPEYTNENIIGKLRTGDKVRLIDTGDGTFWHISVPSLGKEGYVNKDYLY